MPRLLRMPGISADAEEVVFLEWCSTVGSTVAAGGSETIGPTSLGCDGSLKSWSMSFCAALRAVRAR